MKSNRTGAENIVFFETKFSSHWAQE